MRKANRVLGRTLPPKWSLFSDWHLTLLENERESPTILHEDAREEKFLLLPTPASVSPTHSMSSLGWSYDPDVLILFFVC